MESPTLEIVKILVLDIQDLKCNILIWNDLTYLPSYTATTPVLPELLLELLKELQS
jgi:hypothetical protein